MSFPAIFVSKITTENQETFPKLVQIVPGVMGSKNAEKQFFDALHKLPAFDEMRCTHVARGQVPEDSGDEFFDLVVGGLPEEPHQGGDTSRVLDGPLVLVVLTAVAQVPEGAEVW